MIFLLLCLVYEIEPVTTTIYFWTYMVVAYFIIFNMILAVIFNVYNKKTEEIFEQDGNSKSSQQDESRKTK